MKRVFDLLASALGLLVLALPLAVLAWQVRRKLGSPVLFTQVRPGLHGKPFRMVKFRTMTDARDTSGALLPDAQRLTPFGRFLRASSLDELPELWNVLRGEMSLVGPRPVVEAELKRFGSDASYYLLVRPGMTGLWQTSGRSSLDYDKRVYLDAWYVKNWSFWYDLIILFRTVHVVFSTDGAY